MIFSGSTAGGSGGRLSLLLPLRSRRAAAARSWAAILMGLEMVAARRRAGAASCYSARGRAANSVSTTASASWLWCRRHALEMRSAVETDRSIDIQSAALFDGQERPRRARAKFAGLPASVLRLAPMGWSLVSSQKRAHRVGKCYIKKTRPAPAADESATRKRGRGTVKKATTTMQEKLERHGVHLDAPVQVLQGPLRVVHEASRTSKARGVDSF